MNLKEIKEMINLMNDNNLTELEVEREGGRIKLKKASPSETFPVIGRPVEYRVESAPAVSRQAEESASNDAAGKNKKVIASPMVGTFYRAPSPEAAPFVEVGQIVEVGQVVCIVEAMKLMNEIKSEIRGKVVEVAVENAEPVEFGQTLFAVEPL